MTERKLASIQRITDLVEIEGADKIELALILGWQVVVQKGIHQVGDMVVFYEIDSWLSADDSRYESFAERFTTWEGKRGMRLRSIKLRKQLSQGLIMPVREFPELNSGDLDGKLCEGDDVTEILKIEKWEMAEKLPRTPGVQGERKFPTFIMKTDQERIQNYGEMVLRALDEEFEVTVKKDGSSMTVFCVNPDSEYYEQAKSLYTVKQTLWEKFKGLFSKKVEQPVYGICSRNIMLPLEGDSNFHKAARDVLEAMKANPSMRSYAVQGEVVAPDIQGNYEKVSSVEFHVFDVFQIDSQKYATPMIRQEVLKKLELVNATVIATNSLRILLKLPTEGVVANDVVKACLTYASGPGDNKGVAREGVVMKNTQRDFSFKAVSDEYLLKTGK